MIAVIIEHAYLITAVQNRNTLKCEHKRMKHDICSNAQHKSILISLVNRSLNSTERSRRTTESGISEYLGVIIKLTAGRAARPSAGKIIVKILLVRCFGYTEPSQISVVKSPADIIVASQIVLEQTIGWQQLDLLYLMAQELDIPCCQSMPDRAHGSHIVQHVAFRLFRGSEIRYNLLRLHNDFTEEYDSRADYPACKIHHAHKNMYLREVTAVGAKGLPDIWNRIEPDDVNSAIGKIHQIVCHVVEDHRVGIVQIPLERVERCHNDLIAVLKICVVPRRCLRKYLRKCLRIRIRNIPIVVKEISLLSTYVSGSCSLSPLMLFACVVHNKIQTYHHAAPVACSGQFFQIIHRSQIRTHLAKI